MVRDRNEKEAAFRGLCVVIRHNPGGVVKVHTFIYLVYIFGDFVIFFWGGGGEVSSDSAVGRGAC